MHSQTVSCLDGYYEYQFTNRKTHSKNGRPSSQFLMITRGHAMELYQLPSFVTVAHKKHLTKAAEALHISQPAVSAHIKALEEEFGQPLFIRTPKGMTLTSGGDLLCQKAKIILAEVEALVALGENLQHQPTGSIRIGLNRYSEFLRIPLLYQQLHNNFPNIEIRLHQAISGTVLKMIRKNELDCGFFLGDCGGVDLQRLMLAQLKLRVVGPIGMKENLAKVSHEELADLPWIGTPEDCPYTQIMEMFFYKQGLNPQTEVVADQQSAITSMIEAGVGLSFMLEEEAVKAEQQEQVAIWNGGSFPIELSFAYRVKDKHSARVQAVTREILTIWNQDDSSRDNSE